MAPALDITKLAVIGCGSMGGGLAQLFAEHGFQVSVKDPSEDAMNKVLASAKEAGTIGDRLHKFEDSQSLCASLDSPKLILFSLPHGTAGDVVLDGLMPYLTKGDIILDAANEHYENTQRRQAKTVVKGIRYVGVGVSGGYQAARRGPSMCPGADDETLDMVLPILQKVAAKDSAGRPCVAKCGLGGSGHYVKCIHNGIEHGMMSAISEAYHVMKIGLGMSYDEIGGVFERWNAEGELRNTFLVKISANICRTLFPETGTTKHEHVLETVLDKVVQDLTGEEGTGIWSSMEAVRLHVAAPTMTTAHYLRLASAYRGQRENVHKLIDGGFQPQPLEISGKERDAFLEHLRMAVYTSCLASYIQGMNVIEAAEQENKWCIDYQAVWQIWRAGCIIQSDYISEEILKPAFDAWSARNGKPMERGDGETINLLLEKKPLDGLRTGYSSLKKVLARCTEHDFVVPAMSATLEYIKYSTSTDLPTSFYEAQLDYFGAHMYDERGDKVPLPKTGKHHFEWMKA